MGQKKSEKRLKKEDYWRRVWSLFDKYEKALIVDCDNVSSKQIAGIRRSLRDIDAVMLMGKNTLLKAALNRYMTKPEEEDSDYEDRKDTFKERPQIEKMVGLMRGNVGMILSNGDLGEIKTIIDENKRAAPARVGAIAPDDVWIKAGSTGLDPKQTGFFQNLQIQTKIVKTQIEIVNDKRVITTGDKIDGSQAALLEKLHIMPFSYKMTVKKVYDNGAVYEAGVLDITKESMLAALKRGIKNITSASLEAGYPNAASVPHTLSRAFRHLVAATMDSDWTFKEAEKMKEAAKNGPVVAAAPAGGAPAAAAAEPEKKEEEPEEEVDMGGLFGDDY